MTYPSFSEQMSYYALTEAQYESNGVFEDPQAVGGMKMENRGITSLSAQYRGRSPKCYLYLLTYEV